MPIRLAALVLVLFSALQTPLPQQTNQEPEQYLEPQAYEVYGALLVDNRIWGNWISKTKYLVIQQETEGRILGEGECFPHQKEFSTAWAEVLDDYKKTNRIPRLLTRLLPITTAYNLASQQELRDSFKGDQPDVWVNFYRLHPDSGGYIQISAVGFNPDKTKALVYIARHCGNVCGTGDYAMLQKQDGKWNLVQTALGSGCGWLS